MLIFVSMIWTPSIILQAYFDTEVVGFFFFYELDGVNCVA